MFAFATVTRTSDVDFNVVLTDFEGVGSALSFSFDADNYEVKIKASSREYVEEAVSFIHRAMQENIAVSERKTFDIEVFA